MNEPLSLSLWWLQSLNEQKNSLHGRGQASFVYCNEMRSLLSSMNLDTDYARVLKITKAKDKLVLILLNPHGRNLLCTYNIASFSRVVRASCGVLLFHYTYMYICMCNLGILAQSIRWSQVTSAKLPLITSEFACGKKVGSSDHYSQKLIFLFP